MDVEYSEKVGNSEGENNESISERAKNDIDIITNLKEKHSESKQSFDLISKDKESNKILTAQSSNCELKINKMNSDEGISLKAGALSAIAMDYYSSDSEIDEVNESENSQMEMQISNETQEVIINNRISEIEIISNKTQHVEIVNNKNPEIETINNETQELEIISYKKPDIEIISNEKPELEIISHEKPEISIIDKEISKNELNSEKPEVEVLKEYRTHMEITCSSDEIDSEEDSSSSSSSDDDSESSSKSESLSDSSEKSLHETKKVVGKGKQRVRKQSKGEFDDLPPIEDLNINVPEVLCDPLGEVAWIVDQMVVVRPKPGKPTLNLESILFIERGRRVLGRVFDVFGQVSDPHYCVRFNNSKHIQENKIQVGMNVYFCPNTEYTTVVFLHELTKMKACDPTDDDEPPEFSDDEEEQAYYQNLRKQQKTEKAVSESGIPTKKKRIGQKNSSGKKNSTDWKSHHPWNTKRNVQQQTATGAQRVTNSQDSYSQNWYGSMPPYQQNPWPPFPIFPNPAWPMYYPPSNYRGFRPQMGFPSPFHHSQRYSNSTSWNARNQVPQSSQNHQPNVANAITLSPPPPPPPPPSPPQDPSPPGM